MLGPTASGKTKFACQLAYYLDGEIISADSRQVYRHLNIGTGKDLQEYQVNEKNIPYHLIDVCEPHQKFYLHDFTKKLHESFTDITARNKLPVICGGTGLYLEALEKDHHFTQIPENVLLREELSNYGKEELLILLNRKLNSLAQKITIDTTSKKRIIRGIEITEYLIKHPFVTKKKLSYKPKYFGILISKEERNRRIDERLKQRLENGLIEEAQDLIKNGISFERLEYFGLEYKFLSYYLQGKINKKELFEKLSVAIHQYAKRQTTWFRRMERNGIQIQWVNPATFFEKEINPKEFF